LIKRVDLLSLQNFTFIWLSGYLTLTILSITGSTEVLPVMQTGRWTQIKARMEKILFQDRLPLVDEIHFVMISGERGFSL
jgi:hypothetical protein